jgi:hypothetical protein
MYENEIISEKIKIQNKLSKMANFDTKQYFNNTQQNVENKLKEMGITLNYEENIFDSKNQFNKINV